MMEGRRNNPGLHICFLFFFFIFHNNVNVCLCITFGLCLDCCAVIKMMFTKNLVTWRYYVTTLLGK